MKEISLRFQKIAAEQYGFISNGGQGQGNTLHLDTLKENLLRLNIYFSTLNVHTVTGVVNTPFLETINQPPRELPDLVIYLKSSVLSLDRFLE